MITGDEEEYPPPDWYAYLQAAEKLNTKPWKLLPKPLRRKVPKRWWMRWALIAASAEAEAREAIAKRK